jgi:glutamate---cysteine ligase / carboxylate-amine ligase
MPFGRTLTLGVEEELLLLDAYTLEPEPAVDIVVPEKTDRLKTELFACVVETTTEVCADAEEALGQLRALRREVAERAAPHGLVLAGSATHPSANPEVQQIVDEPRYQKMVAELGGVARGQLVCGLHVHVGMPTEEACLRAMEGTLPWLPVVLGLSANSPYLAGEDTGLRSSRSARLQELPRADVPPYFASWADWETFMAGRDYTRSWWDVRPHPRLGTLEIRIADQPTDVRRSAALAALLQALAAVAAEADPPPADRAAYLRDRERAARKPLPAGELAELIETRARELGGWELASELLTAAPEADRQLEIGRSQGLHAVTADIVERSRV